MGKSGWLGVPVRGRQPVVGLEDAPPRWPRDAESLGKWKCEPRKGHEWLRPVGRKPSPPCPLPRQISDTIRPSTFGPKILEV